MPLPLKWQEAILTTSDLVIPSEFGKPHVIAQFSSGLKALGPREIKIAPGEFKDMLLQKRKER